MKWAAVENTHLLCMEKYQCTGDLQCYWFGLNQASKSVDNFNVIKTTLSKSAKLEVSLTKRVFTVSETSFRYVGTFSHIILSLVSSVELNTQDVLYL